MEDETSLTKFYAREIYKSTRNTAARHIGAYRQLFADDVRRGASWSNVIQTFERIVWWVDYLISKHDSLWESERSNIQLNPYLDDEFIFRAARTERDKINDYVRQILDGERDSSLYKTTMQTAEKREGSNFGKKIRRSLFLARSLSEYALPMVLAYYAGRDAYERKVQEVYAETEPKGLWDYVADSAFYITRYVESILRYGEAVHAEIQDDIARNYPGLRMDDILAIAESAGAQRSGLEEPYTGSNQSSGTSEGVVEEQGSIGADANTRGRAAPDALRWIEEYLADSSVRRQAVEAIRQVVEKPHIFDAVAMISEILQSIPTPQGRHLALDSVVRNPRRRHNRNTAAVQDILHGMGKELRGEILDEAARVSVLDNRIHTYVVGTLRGLLHLDDSDRRYVLGRLS